MDKKSLLDIALQYHRLGFNVIPAIPRGKMPALDTWREYQTRMSTEKEIRSWWRSNPKYNIGAITGRISGIVVVDVDDPNKAMPTLMPYRTGLVAASGKGTGYHLYYQYPTYASNVPNRVKFLQGADIRADGGFIILPPSVHPTGRLYTWGMQGDMIELPHPLFDLIVQRSSDPLPPSEETGWVTSLINGGSQSGSRDDDATRLAGYFAAQGLPPDIILSILRGWYDRSDQTGFNWSQVEKCVASIYAKESSLQTTNQPPPIASLTTNALSFLGAIDEIKWLIDDWMPQASTCLMVAPPGSFKTWIMMSMCLSIATGFPFLNRYPVKHGKVLMIQVEDGKPILRQRLRTIYSNMLADNYTVNFIRHGDGDWEINLPPALQMDIWTADYMLTFANPEDMKLLEKMIVENHYDFIIFDPLYAFADAEDYMSAAAQKMMQLKGIRDRTGCSFMVLHHTKKGDKGADKDDDSSIERQDAWGSQFLNAWLEFGIQIRGMKSDKTTVRLLRHGKMTKGYTPIRLKMSIDTTIIEEESFQVEIEDIASVNTSNLAQTRADGKVDTNIDESAVLQLAVSQGGIIRHKDVVDSLSFSKSTASLRLTALVNKGYMVKNEDGSWSVLTT